MHVIDLKKKTEFSNSCTNIRLSNIYGILNNTSERYDLIHILTDYTGATSHNIYTIIQIQRRKANIISHDMKEKKRTGDIKHTNYP